MKQLPDNKDSLSVNNNNNNNETFKRKYLSPQLVEYGSVTTLTKGQTGSLSDGNSGMASLM